MENSVVYVEGADDMLEIASKIEEAINPINEARFAVIRYMEELGEEKKQFEP